MISVKMQTELALLRLLFNFPFESNAARHQMLASEFKTWIIFLYKLIVVIERLPSRNMLHIINKNTMNDQVFVSEDCSSFLPIEFIVPSLPFKGDQAVDAHAPPTQGLVYRTMCFEGR